MFGAVRSSALVCVALTTMGGNCAGYLTLDFFGATF
jgi:hypothetical protein